MKRRHRARRLALQGLCCLDVQGQDGEEPLFDFLQNSKEPAEVISLAREMISKTFSQKSEIDKIIKSQSEHWDISRIGLVERNILRLAIWEMLASNTPVKVIINEAILLAEEFASSESARFINGLLDAIAKKLVGKEIIMSTFTHVLNKVDSNERPDCNFFQFRTNEIPANFFPEPEPNKYTPRGALESRPFEIEVEKEAEKKVFYGFKIHKYKNDDKCIRLFYNDVHGFKEWLSTKNLSIGNKVVFEKTNKPPYYRMRLK